MNTTSIQDDLAAYRAAKSSGAPVAQAAPVQSSTSSDAPASSVEPTDPTDIGQALSTYRSQKSSGTVPKAPDVPKDPGILSSLAKSLFTAPATIAARPFQAAAELAGASADQVDAATSKIPLVGGFVAPVDRNFGDVKKDVGRAAETVALGTGAPIAGGALFGAGSSLEQGNDLMSAQTAVEAALGAGGGKVLDWVGKPLLNAAGKVVGTITPKIIQDVAKGGTKAIQDFAQAHQLLGGIAAKPSEAIANGLQKVDEAIGSGVKKVVSSTGDVLKDQFPGLNPVEHFKAVNKAQFMAPTETNTPGFAKATEIAKDAERRGINIGDELNKLGIQHDQNAGGGLFNTKETEALLRNKNYSDSNKVLRPAIQAIEPSVQKVPLSAVRQAMLEKTTSISDATEREAMQKDILRKYSDTSAEARAHPDGYSLTDLHDGRINAGQNGKYIPGVSTPPTVQKAKLARQEAGVFKNLFDTSLPKGSAIDGVRKEFEKNFILADYLKSINGKKVPQNIVQKSVRLFGRGLGGVIGSKVAGFPGFLVGSRGGDMLFNAFETLDNPLKEVVLNRLKVEEPKSFETLKKYLGDQETARLLRKALPAAGGSSFKTTQPTLFTTPGGVSTPNKGAAIDLTAVEQGRAKPPTTDRRLKSYLTKVQQAQDTTAPYVPEKDLPVIKAGKKVKPARALNDIFLK